MVVGQQDAGGGLVGGGGRHLQGGGRRMGAGGGGVLGLGQGQDQGEGRAFARGRCRVQFAPHQLGQVARDRQPQARAAIAPGDRAVGLDEAAEQGVLARRFEADARVAHRQAIGVLGGVLGLHPQHHRALGRELHRIAEQVDQDLLGAHRIAHHLALGGRIDLDLQRHLLLARGRDEQGGGLAGQVGQAERLGVDRQPAGFHPGDVQDVGQQVVQGDGRVLDDRDHLLLAGVEGGAGQHAGDPQHAVQGRADLVAHIGQELALGAVGGLGGVAGLGQQVGVAVAGGDVDQGRQPGVAAVVGGLAGIGLDLDDLAVGAQVAPGLLVGGDALGEQRLPHAEGVVLAGLERLQHAHADDVLGLFVAVLAQGGVVDGQQAQGLAVPHGHGHRVLAEHQAVGFLLGLGFQLGRLQLARGLGHLGGVAVVVGVGGLQQAERAAHADVAALVHDDEALEQVGGAARQGVADQVRRRGGPFDDQGVLVHHQRDRARHIERAAVLGADLLGERVALHQTHRRLVRLDDGDHQGVGFGVETVEYGLTRRVR